MIELANHPPWKERTIEPIYATIGQNICKERKELGFTQAELASEVGLTRASIVNIEAGRQRMLIHTLCQIAEALGVGVIHLMMKGGPHA